MIACTLAEIAEVVGGRLADADPDAVVTRPAVIDSREVEPGTLFAALPGERADGHDFAAAAVQAGAVAVLGTRPVGVPAVVVADVVQALTALAQHVRSRIPQLTVVGLTGSAGKTSTKDLIAQVLPILGPTTATPRSFNNEIGLPLTVLRADSSTRYLVLEMGARHAGHIAHLCSIVPPSVGLVLNVGTAHVGVFGGREAIATAKSELIAALPSAEAGGLAVLNADDPLVMGMAKVSGAPVVTFGRAETADAQARDVRLDEAGRPHFTMAYRGAVSEVHLNNLRGEHNVANACAAAAVALGLGAELEQVAAALSRAEHVTPGRMQVIERPDGVTVINDAFNSSPDAALLSLRALAAMRAGRRTVALLGEMRELGPDAEEGHRRVGAAAADTGVDVLITVGGPDADTIAKAALDRRPGLQMLRATDRDEALSVARSVLVPGDICLVKGSKAVGLQHTADLLGQADEAAAPA